MTDIQTSAHQQFEIQKTKAANIYTPEFVSSLAKQFNIEADQKQLRELLIFAAAIYLDQNRAGSANLNRSISGISA